MEKIINDLRSKPEEERRNLLHFVTIIFAIVMLILWSYSLGSTFGNPETQEQLKEDIKPFQELTQSLSGSYESIASPTSETE